MQPSAGLLLNLGLVLCFGYIGVGAGTLVGRDYDPVTNGQDAINLNALYMTLNASAPCITNEIACISNELAQCSQGQYQLTPCNAGLVCRASPIIGSPGVTTACVTEAENEMRILATGVNYTPPVLDPSETSLCLDPAVISTGFDQNGQDNITSVGQVPSLTSSNNWINFCKTVGKPLTNGTQIKGGSCNPAPIGVIPSFNNMPSAKFIFPPNFAALTKHKTFTIEIVVNNLNTGWFTNPDTTYMSAPLIVDGGGNVMGHSHVVVESITGFGQTVPTDPRTFVFFKGLDTVAVNGVLSTNLTGGLPAGYYRIAVMHSGANHQPIATPVAQRGTMNDMVYFSVV